VTGLQAGEFRPQDSIPVMVKDLSLFQNVQTAFVGHPASCLEGTGHLSPAVRRTGRESDRYSPFSAETENKWSYSSIPPCAFMACTVTDLPLL
jgi:hypothetical protein